VHEREVVILGWRRYRIEREREGGERETKETREVGYSRGRTRSAEGMRCY
jgi:hypothetical protein